MTTAWIVISGILSVIWVIVFVVGNVMILFDTMDEFRGDKARQKDAYRGFAAIMAGAAVFALMHWIVLLLVIPAFIAYGLYSGVRLLVTRPWKKTEDA